MKIAVISPVLNEAQFIGFSVMAAHPYVEEFVYAISPKSNDGTIEILRHIAKRYGKVRLLIDPRYDFDPRDTAAYNKSFNDCIDQTRCEAVWFLHPDMIVTKWAEPKEGPLAWTTKITSYAKDLSTVITKGRCSEWKNIHARKFGLRYQGAYGSQNEDFYHSEITGGSLKHYGTDFKKYPFEVGRSGIELNHYCENKPYERRLQKMKICLETLYPTFSAQSIEEMAVKHPRVTLEKSSSQFGEFEFEAKSEPIPEVFTKYKHEFDAYTPKEAVHA